MSFALIFMCCSAGCYCNVHVQVALHVQVHVLVVCRCSAWSAAYVIRVQLPGILWNLYDCKVSCTVFFSLPFLCDIVFAPLVFCASLILLFFFLSIFFFPSPKCIILLRVFRVAVWTNDDVLSIISVVTVSVRMNSGGLQGGFYDVVWLMAFVLGFVK